MGWGGSEAAAALQNRRDARASRLGSRRLRRRPWARVRRRENSACRLPASGAAGRVPRPEWPPPQETLRDTGLSRSGGGRPDLSDPSGRVGWGQASRQVPPPEGRPGARRPPERPAGRVLQRGRPRSTPLPPPRTRWAGARVAPRPPRARPGRSGGSRESPRPPPPPPARRARAVRREEKLCFLLLPFVLKCKELCWEEKCPSSISVRSSSWGARRRRSSTNM